MKIILYKPHRQLNNIINDLRSQKNIVCINMDILWKLIPLTSKYKLKFKFIGFFFKILNPSFIITTNWISRYDAFYSIWTKRNPNTKFVVVQHGTYVGGMVTVNSHKYIRSDVFLTWGNYHKEYFKILNDKKNVEIFDFGNPLYNGINREKFEYSKKKIQNALIVTSGVTKDGVKKLKQLVFELKKKGLNVDVKLHNHQEKKFGFFDFEGIDLVNDNAYEILNTDKYELFIVDHSSFMIDAIFFKKKVLFFPQFDRGHFFYDNVYSDFLESLKINHFKNNIITDIDSLVNIKTQEDLLNKLVTIRKSNYDYPFN